MPEYTSHHNDQANSYQEIGRYPVGSRQKENGISKKKMINGAAANHLKYHVQVQEGAGESRYDEGSQNSAEQKIMDLLFWK